MSFHTHPERADTVTQRNHASMNFEHVAINVPEPIAMAAWYEKHLGLEIVRAMNEAPHTHFLRDSGGAMMLEIYRNPPDNVPDYASMDPLLLHLAFVSEDPAGDKTRLVNAGATLVEELHLDDGSHIVMLRDPWGVSFQLCKRGVPMLARQ